MNLYSILLVAIIAIFYLAFARRTKRKSQGPLNAIYREWSKQSIVSKLEGFVGFLIALFYLGIVLLIGYLSYKGFASGEMPEFVQKIVEKLDFESKSEQDIIMSVSELAATYLAVLMALVMAAKLVNLILNALATFDIARWMSKNNVEPSTLKGGGHYTAVIRLGSGAAI